MAEALLFSAGAITRMGKVEDGNTVSDHDAEEVRRGISVSLSLVPVEWNGVKINVLDAPGYADFIGDVKGALRAADVCLFVVSAVDGVEVQTEVVWEMAAEAGLPRAIFVNRIDRERASFERTLEGLITAFGTPDTEKQAMRIGANDYLAKPFDFEELERRVRSFFQSRAKPA